MATTLPGEFWPRRLRLLKRRTLWWPTWRCWVITSVIVLGILYLAFRRLHPFLAVTQRVHADTLIVEGWIPIYGLEAAQKEFTSGGYAYLVTTGGPLEVGSVLTGYDNYAELSAAILRKLGFPDERVMAAAAAPTFRNRTYMAAMAAMQSLRESNRPTRGINVFTLGTHGRRTWTVYQTLAPAGMPVGVISLPSEDYDPNHWWHTSEGLKTVMTEGLGWLYEWLWSSGR